MSIYRSRNKRNDLMRRSWIPQYKTIEEFNFSWQPCINRRVIYALGTYESILKKENIAFISLPETGKTHLSIALGVKAIEPDYTVLFTTLSEMMEDIYIPGRQFFSAKLKKYVMPDLLLIDEYNSSNKVHDFSVKEGDHCQRMINKEMPDERIRNG